MLITFFRPEVVMALLQACDVIQNQWWIQGRGPGSSGPLVFLDQTEARRAEKIIFETDPPSYLRVWMTAPPASSEMTMAASLNFTEFSHLC